MSDLVPMFHMDADYRWRWYLTDHRSIVVVMSVQAFFSYEEACRDYEAVCPPAD
jgi:hypothetical protein